MCCLLGSVGGGMGSARCSPYGLATRAIVTAVDGVHMERAPLGRGSLGSRPVSRILSRVAISLGRQLPDGSSGVPGSSAGHVNGTCFALHRTGFGEPPCHHGAGGLLPHPFTLTGGRAPAVSFLCHFPSAFAVWGFPSVLPCGVRTFLGASRPRDHPACDSHCNPDPAAASFGDRVDAHSGHEISPSRCSRNSPHTRHSRLAPRSTA